MSSIIGEIAVLLSLGWDSLVPGTQVRGLSEKPIAGSPSAEAHVYVGNSSCVSSPNCLVYDFADIAKGKSRGYPAVDLPAVADGWSVFSICFKRESGSVGGEIRGRYDFPGQGANGARRTWPFLWLTFDEMFSVKVEGQPRWRIVRVGHVLPNVWHRVQIAIPPPGEVNAVARVRLERMDAKGVFSVVGAADIPFGELVLRKATSFDLTGSGPCEFLFDDLKMKGADKGK